MKVITTTPSKAGMEEISRRPTRCAMAFRMRIVGACLYPL